MSRTGISLSILWWIYGDEVLRVGELARGLLNGCKDKGLFIATYKCIQFKNFLCHFLLKSSGPPLLSYLIFCTFFSSALATTSDALTSSYSSAFPSPSLYPFLLCCSFALCHSLFLYFEEAHYAIGLFTGYFTVSSF